MLSRSPLNIGDKNIFVNYWNLNQTVLVEGWSTMKQFNLLKSVLLSRNSHCKVKPWNHRGDSAMDLANIKELFQRSLHFDHILDQLRIQLRYSVLALLSENKVSIFNEDLIDLMRVL